MNVHDIANSIITAYVAKSSGASAYIAGEIKVLYAAIVDSYLEAEKRINPE